MTYIMKIIEETRTNANLMVGASPRAGEHLLYASKAYSLIHGRYFVTPDDVKKVTSKVLSHRLITSVDAELEGVTTDKIIDDILSSIDIPNMLKLEKVA